MFIIRARRILPEGNLPWAYFYQDQHFHSPSKQWGQLKTIYSSEEFTEIDADFLEEDGWDKNVGPVLVELVNLFSFEVTQKLVSFN